MSAPVLKHPKVQEEIKRIKAEHSDKTKQLMKSIDKLKLDIEKEKYQGQDNVRAKIIERMKKDIADNETVIEMMRGMINDDDLINKEIVKVLSKGPLRARVLSREELRMEIDRLTKEVDQLKRGGIIKKKKRKKSTEQSEDNATEKSFENLTLENYKELKAQYEATQQQLDEKIKECEEANTKIDDFKVDIRGRDMNLRMLMDKVNGMEEETSAFKKVREKLKEMRKKGFFKDLDLDHDEEDKIIEQLFILLEQKDVDHEKYRSELEQTKKDRAQEVDELVDEYNVKDEEFQSINDRYIALKRQCKTQQLEVRKYKEEMEEAQNLANELKAEFKEKLKSKRDEILDLQKKVADLEEALELKEKRILELQDELEQQLQRTPGRSEDSMDSDPYALFNEKQKVAKLSEELKKCYDIIDSLKVKVAYQVREAQDKTLERARSASRERKKD